MDFIEKWFGVSPDGGESSSEMLYVGVVVVIGLAIMFRSRIRRLLDRGPSARVPGLVEKGMKHQVAIMVLAGGLILAAGAMARSPTSPKQGAKPTPSTPTRLQNSGITPSPAQRTPPKYEEPPMPPKDDGSLPPIAGKDTTTKKSPQED
jgi:hypothetical protein